MVGSVVVVYFCPLLHLQQLLHRIHTQTHTTTAALERNKCVGE